jgi:hypothetical protein
MSGEDSGGLFEDLSEEDQMLTLLAGRIRFAIENTPGTRVGKDEVALVIITETHGPSFAKRVLKLPEQETWSRRATSYTGITATVHLAH